MYQIKKGTDGFFDALFVSFDHKDSDIAQKLFSERVLSKEKLDVLSVQYSDKRLTFKIVMHPGTNFEELSTRVQNKINVAAQLYGLLYGSGTSSDTYDWMNNLFGGKS